MVEAVPIPVEWGQPDGKRNSPTPFGDPQVECLGRLGLRSLYLHGGMVPVHMARGMEKLTLQCKTCSPSYLPVLFGAANGVERWVQYLCDNAAVVATINKGSSTNDVAMHLLGSLFFFVAHFNLDLQIQHVLAKWKVAAHSPPRDKLPLLIHQVPTATLHSILIPNKPTQALILHQPDWTSGSWRVCFTSILLRVLAPSTQRMYRSVQEWYVKFVI